MNLNIFSNLLDKTRHEIDDMQSIAKRAENCSDVDELKKLMRDYRRRLDALQLKFESMHKSKAIIQNAETLLDVFLKISPGLEKQMVDRLAVLNSRENS